MITDEDRLRRLKVVRRLATAMAEFNGDSILKEIEFLTDSEFNGSPKTDAELDADNPCAKAWDGSRFYAHVRRDGRGQLNIIWPSGNERIFKFLIPDSLLSEISSSGTSPASKGGTSKERELAPEIDLDTPEKPSQSTPETDASRKIVLRRRVVYIAVLLLLLSPFIPVIKDTKNYRFYDGEFNHYSEFSTSDVELIEASKMKPYIKNYDGPWGSGYLSIEFWKTIYGKPMFIRGAIKND